MNTVDVVISVILLFGLVKGFMKGLFVEIASLAGLILGIYGAIHFSDYLADYLKKSVSWDASLIQMVAFAGTFLMILVGLIFLGKILTKILESVSLGIFNKLLGSIFGVLKYALILSILALVYSQITSTIPFADQKKTEKSLLYESVKNLAPAIFPGLIRLVEEETNQK